MLHGVINQAAKLVVVVAPRNDRNEGHVDAKLVADRNALLLDFEHTRALHRHVRGLVEGVKRERHARAELREPLRECAVFHDPNAVGANRHAVHALFFCDAEHLEELRMQGGLRRP